MTNPKQNYEEARGELVRDMTLVGKIYSKSEVRERIDEVVKIALEEQMKEVMKCWPKHRVITNTFSALNKDAIKLNQREDYCLDKFKESLKSRGLI